MLHNGADDFDAHFVGELNRVGVNLAVLDGLLALGLPVETDDDDLRRFVRLLQRSTRAECGGVVDGEDATQVAVGLEGVLSGFVTDILRATAVEFHDQVDFRGGLGVVSINDLAKTFHAKTAGLGLFEMQNDDLAARRAERLDHREARFLAAAVVVRRDLREQLHARLVARNVHGEHGDAGGVGLLNHRHDGARLARAEDDGDALLHDEVLHVVRLARDVGVGTEDDGVVAMLRGLGGDAVADDLEEGVLQREQRDADGAFLGRGGSGCRAGGGWLGWLCGFVATDGEGQQGEGKSEEFQFHDGDRVWPHAAGQGVKVHPQ